MPLKTARCSHGKCRRRPRENGRYCALCHAAANRRSHRKHRKERNTRRRDRAEDRDESARAADSARAKLYVAIGRGNIRKGSCAVCHGRDHVTAYIADPKHWMEAVWACAEHRSQASGEGISPRKSSERRASWQNEREHALTALAALPEDERERFYAIAERGPAGMVINRDAPLFTIQLVRAYKAST